MRLFLIVIIYTVKCNNNTNRADLFSEFARTGYDKAWNFVVIFSRPFS